ncbi:MAG: deoxyguanosinetriphosphate triphosphohydrolase [Clostridia bacterium]|nr:deoxyguanosinetriphosphate triphosphohydrolase [Clostridia bacterium]
MLPRLRTEEIERQMLSPKAALACESKGRLETEPPCDFRTDFQRDRDRVLHCKAFRRLRHKTQVFLSPEGDHYRTRLTHTLEVSQIARTVARALRLNEDLTEAVALAHDLGHTPFGHAGERALNRCMDGGFRHYEQSLRVVDLLEKDGQGLNLTWEVRDGILNHTTGEQAATLEGRIVRLADKVAYINHDIDDAIRAGVFSEADIPSEVTAVLGANRNERFNTMIGSIIETSDDDITMSAEVWAAFDKLHSFMFDRLYFNPIAKNEEKKVDAFISRMFAYFIDTPDKLPPEFRAVYEREGAARAACDYIAGMTDTFAVQMYNELFIPQGWPMVSGIGGM